MRRLMLFSIAALALYPMTGRAESCAPVIATLYGESLCLAPDKDAPNPGKLVAAKIWEAALTHKFPADKLNPTAEEIAAFTPHYQTALNASYKADRAAAAQLRAELAKNDLKPEARERLQTILDLADKSVALYEQRAERISKLPDQYRNLATDVETQIVTNVLSGWKRDKALFETYGGEIYGDGANIRPLDAYRAFAADIATDKNIVITDNQYKTALPDWLAAQEKILKPLPSKASRAKIYFAAPPISLVAPDTSGREADIKKLIENLRAR